MKILSLRFFVGCITGYELDLGFMTSWVDFEFCVIPFRGLQSVFLEPKVLQLISMNSSVSLVFCANSLNIEVWAQYFDLFLLPALPSPETAALISGEGGMNSAFLAKSAFMWQCDVLSNPYSKRRLRVLQLCLVHFYVATRILSNPYS